MEGPSHDDIAAGEVDGMDELGDAGFGGARQCGVVLVAVATGIESLVAAGEGVLQAVKVGPTA